MEGKRVNKSTSSVGSVESEDSVTHAKQIAGKECSKKQESRQFVDNPVLCYLTCLFGKRPGELLEDVLSSFFAEEELHCAKVQLLSDSESLSLALHPRVKAKHVQGNPKKKMLDAGDLLTIIQEIDKRGALESLPKYVTSTVFRIPDEDPNDKNPRVLQSEIKVLRTEVSSLRQLMSEKFELLQDELRARVTTPVAPPRPSKSPARIPQHQIQILPSIKETCTSSSNLHMAAADNTTGEKGTFKGDAFLAFFGGQCPLSNFHASKVQVDGTEFPTSEHAYQHAKAKMAGEDHLANEIQHAKSPGAAKQIGDSINALDGLGSAMSDIKLVSAMENVCLQKFEQNASAREYLLKTDGLQLVEATQDKLWGSGLSLSHMRTTDKTAWTGFNGLGKALTRVRARLYSNSSAVEHRFDLDNYCLEAQHTDDQVGPVKKTFAELVQDPGEWHLKTNLKKRRINKTRGTNETNKLIKGVEKKPLLDFYVGQLDESTSEEDFKTFLKEEGIETLTCNRLVSKIPDTIAFRFRCDATLKDKVLDSSTWPSNVIVREWIRKPRVFPRLGGNMY